MATIITKNSSTASAAPAVGDLTKGELAVNVTDKKLYTKDNSAAIVKIVGSLGNQEASAVAITGGSIAGITDLAVADGGTGASSAADARTNLGVTATGADTTYAFRSNNLSDLASASTARTNLGLGTIATQAASSVTITGGSVTGITDITVADGGTGASTATNARINLGAAASGANSDITSITGLTTALTVAQGGTGVTTSTGTGNAVLSNSPTLVTPALGTPASATLTNATGLPISTGVSGLGTGVATALAVNVGSAGAAVVNGGALGTPSSGTATNLTGLPLSTGVTGTLPVANGGTGTATPSIVAGTNVTVTGTWPNQTIAASGGGGGGTPGGSTTQVQYNNAGAFGGITGATTNGTALTLVAPVLGTPASATLTNAIGLPLSTGVTGTLPVANGGTGVTTSTGTGNVVLSASPTLTGDVTLNAQGDLRFADADSSNWVAFQAPATVASNVTWTLPAADGTSAQVLSTNGSGTLSWATASGGSSQWTTTSTDIYYNTGRAYVGTTSSLDQNAKFQVATVDYYVFNGFQFSNDEYATTLSLKKSRGTTIGANTIVQNGDTIGTVSFFGANGTSYTSAAAINAQIDGTPGSSSDMPGRLVFLTTSDGAGSPTERMRISCDGTVSLASTFAIFNTTPNSSNPGWKTQKGGNQVYTTISHGTQTTTAEYFYFVNGNGTVGSIASSGSSTSYNTSSDYRLKNSIAPMTGALAKVAQLKPVTYKWNADGSNGEGFIAHELAEVMPQCVSGEKDAMRTEKYEISPFVPATYDEEGNQLTSAIQAVIGEREVPAHQGIDTSFLVATLTAAIQEQQTIIESLKARLDAANL